MVEVDAGNYDKAEDLSITAYLDNFEYLDSRFDVDFMASSFNSRVVSMYAVPKYGSVGICIETHVTML